MNNGWIKISRDLPDHWLWQDAERLKWWLDLIFMAQWEDKQWMHDSHRFVLRRGQIVASVSYLVERWKRSKPTVINFLKQLEQDGMIERETIYRQTSIITICNYESYQCNVDTIVDPLTKSSKNLDPISNRKVDMQNQSLTGCKHESSRCKDNDGVDTIVDTINDTIVDPIVDTNKEIKKYIVVVVGNARYTRERFFEDFFSESRKGVIESICMNNYTDEATLKRLAKEILDEWECIGEPLHKDLADARRHLLNQLRKKLEAERHAQKQAESQTSGAKNQHRNGKGAAPKFSNPPTDADYAEDDPDFHSITEKKNRT